MRALLLCAAMLVSGCKLHSFSYRCTSSQQCGSTGLCVDGACAFPAASCSSGFQFDRTATEGRAGQCAELSGDGGTNVDGGGDLASSVDMVVMLACNPSSVYCIGANLRHCAADGLSSMLIDTCSTPEICATSGLGGCGSPLCAAGDINCVGAQLQKCNPGQNGWTNVDTCATAQLCLMSTAAGCTPPTCTAGAVQCAGAAFQNCNAGQTAFVTVDTCVTTQLCAVSTGSACTGPSCAPGDLQCGAGGKSNTVQTCNAGRTGWDDVMACTAPRTCGGGGTDGVCGGCTGTLPGPTMVNVGTYCIDSTEVSQYQYNQFLTAIGTNFSGQPSMCAGNNSYAQLTSGGPACSSTSWNPAGTPNLPAACTDWCDAFAYCKWAGKRLCGKIGGGSVEIVTDAKDSTKDQWQHACTDGGAHILPYGDAFDSNACISKPSFLNYGNVGTTACKGTGAPYSGIFDMSGNAWEWEDSCMTSGNTFCRARGGDVHGIGTGQTTAQYQDYYQCSGGSSGGDVWQFDLTGGGIRCCAD